MKHSFFWIFLPLALLLFGCAQTDLQTEAPEEVSALPKYPKSVFEPKVVITPEQLFLLSDEQRLSFQRYYFDPKYSKTPGHNRLYDYLALQTENFTFKGKTYTAAEAFEYQEGNCMSLALLTAALADVVDIEIKFQRVNSAPVYQKYANVMTLSSHVRTFVFDPSYEPEKNKITIIKPSIIVDYFPESTNVRGRRISNDEFVAMYYQNMAGEALINNDLDLAFAYIQQGLSVAPKDVESLNTLAVLLGKKGETDAASEIYQYILSEEIGTVTTLSNFALLKTNQGDIVGAEQLFAMVEKIDDDNPYRWISVADEQFDKGKYRMARKYYRKATEVAPYLAQSYQGLANTYYQTEQPEIALKYLKKARDLVYVPEEEALYQQKLVTLKTELENNSSDIEPNIH